MPADRDEILELLTEKARAGNVSAMKALLVYHERADDGGDQPADDWSAIYGDGDNVTPLRRKAS